MTGLVPFLFGGRACLDFANTVNSRVAAPTRNHLADYDAVLGWCRPASLLPEGIIRILRERTQVHPAEADAAHGQANTLREALFRLCRAVAASRLRSDRDITATRTFDGGPILLAQEGSLLGRGH